MIVIFLIFLTFYLTFMLFSSIGFVRLLIKQPDKSNQKFTFSIIVPFRNEESRIDYLLDSLKHQCFDRVDNFLFINDHSIDMSPQMINNWININDIHAKVLNLDNGFGKKKAIDFGIRSVKSEYVLIIDADVSFSPDFINIFVETVTDKKDLYILPVIETKGFGLSVLESYMLNVITLGFANFNSPILASGAGLLIKRSSFERCNPFHDNFHISSGDDMFILQKFSSTRQMKIDVVSPSKIYLKTLGPTNYKQYLQRALRWTGKMKTIKMTSTKIFGLLVISVNLLLLSALIYLLIKPSLIVLICIGIKCLVDLFVLSIASLSYGNIKILLYSFPMFFIFPLHLVLVFILLLLNRPISWKGRTVLMHRVNE